MAMAYISNQIDVFPAGIVTMHDSGRSENKPTGGETIGLGVAIGGGVGASLAITQGGLVGTSLVTVWGAGLGGVAAAGYAGWGVGSWVYERPIVRDNIQKALEAIWPNDSKEKPPMEITVPEKPGDKFSVSFYDGAEVYDVNFYMDGQGDEGISMGQDWHSDVDYYFDAWAANDAAEKAGLYWPSWEEVAVIGNAGTTPIDVMVC